MIKQASALVALATIVALPTTILAQQADRDVPPAGSMALSELVQKLETDLASELGTITDVSWDDDGFWDVEYRNTENREVEIRVDPASGEVQQ
ncbi:PepSY domain-containing protein [Paracoccus caeni]|uniref:PepSY domain-containing protein n=1 Tax=Paracoccus caeni TaxID=657651 RepID=A0A934SG00_9RHOB|nr:PepSY domain-containing protein [Paracoccus caeni]MBK4216953.1 PepSY domain-containing protein [Paracoccus caeni]